MHIDVYIVLGSAAVGLLVGLTGASGGALMTPMLIFLFGISPSAAITSDLVASVLMRPVGAAVHLRRRTANLKMVAVLAAGSVPGAFLGAYLLHLVGAGKAAEDEIEVVLGVALLLGAAAMAVRGLVRRRPGADGEPGPEARSATVALRPLPTVLVGVGGGVMVGLTSVGAGSLMIVLLLFVYPSLASSQLVGTDLVQAVPLSVAAALGQVLLGHAVPLVTISVAIGSVPAVLVGSLLSSRAPDRHLRPVIAAVIVVSGLEYVGLSDAGIGIAALVAAVAVGAWALFTWRRRPPAAAGGVAALAPAAELSLSAPTGP